MKRSLRQLQDVDDLALLLELAGLSLDADDIADVVWLAQFIQPTAPAAGPTDEEDAEVEGQEGQQSGQVQGQLLAGEQHDREIGLDRCHFSILL